MGNFNKPKTSLTMKKISIVIMFVAVTAFAAQAQEFKKFKVGVGGGYAVTSGTGAKGGVLLYLEPAYRIQDQLLVGLRLEAAGMVRGYAENVETASISASFSGSQGIFGQYYFSNNTFRPFVGLGLGLNKIATAAANFEGEAFAALNESKFGFFPRVGFDAGHFTLSLDYNLIGASTLQGTSGGELKTKNNYIGIRFGGFFGGGRN
jgi:outer membrane protein W